MTNSPSMQTPDSVVVERLKHVREVIAEVGRADATIVAVTKGFDRSGVDCAQRVGLTDIGENYAQELLDKIDAINADTTVHFMGRVQRNKIRKIAEQVTTWHSVSRPEVITEIAKRCADPALARVFLQIRPEADTTETKDGARPADIDALLETARDVGVSVVGLMTIGVFGDPHASKAAFVEVAQLADQFALAERSMGMSGDYRDALEAGATTLRLGSLLFGERPPR